MGKFNFTIFAWMGSVPALAAWTKINKLNFAYSKRLSEIELKTKMQSELIFRLGVGGGAREHFRKEYIKKDNSDFGNVEEGERNRIWYIIIRWKPSVLVHRPQDIDIHTTYGT